MEAITKTKTSNQPAAKPHPASSKSTHKSSKITPYKIWLTIFLLLWVILATYAGQLIVAYPMTFLLGEKIQQPGWMMIYYLITYAITLALIILVPPQVIKLYRKHHKSEPRKYTKTAEQDLTTTTEEMGIQKLPTFVDIGLAPIAYFVYLTLAAILTNIMQSFPWFDPGQAQDVGFGYFITDLDRIFAMISIVLIAPIAEELMMRGWLYGKLRNKWNVAVAIILTSLCFAFLHGQWNVAVTVFALSVILCGLREITGTIWSGMLLHILSNGIAFYLLYVAI